MIKKLNIKNLNKMIFRELMVFEISRDKKHLKRAKELDKEVKSMNGWN